MGNPIKTKLNELRAVLQTYEYKQLKVWHDAPTSHPI